MTGDTMYDRTFFRSQLGRTALLSIAAMVAMNIVALTEQLRAVPATYAAGTMAVELA
ncbi:MAG: hypothetical protein ABW203_02990 [Novosphingobium sp.]